MVSFTSMFLIVLIAYFTIVMWEGFRAYRRTKGDEDYLVAGRKVGAWVCGASLAATQMSAGTFVGTVAVHYLTGASWIWCWSGIWLAYAMASIFIAPKLRRYSVERGGLTFLDYIGDRFRSNTARVVAGILIIIAYIVFMSAQYQAGGVIIQTLFGLPYVYGALILMVLTVAYTALGGLKAVMNTDFLQQVAMAVGVVVGLPLLVQYAGGFENIRLVLADVGPKFLSWHYGFRDLLGAALAFGVTFASAPYVLVRFYTVPDDRTAQRAVVVALLFNLITATAVAIMGMTLKVLYPNLVVADAASTVFASQVLPPLLGALVMTAVVAAVMSTVDSVLMVTAPIASFDIYYRIINPAATPRARMAINRWSMVVIGAIPILLTLKRLDIVQFVVVAYSAILGSIVFVPVVLGLYWRRASTAGCIAAMACGFTVCLLWYALNQPFRLNPVIPGVLAALTAMYVASLATKPVPEENLRIFFHRGTASNNRG